MKYTIDKMTSFLEFVFGIKEKVRLFIFSRTDSNYLRLKTIKNRLEESNSPKGFLKWGSILLVRLKIISSGTKNSKTTYAINGKLISFQKQYEIKSSYSYNSQGIDGKHLIKNECSFRAGEIDNFIRSVSKTTKVKNVKLTKSLIKLADDVMDIVFKYE